MSWPAIISGPAPGARARRDVGLAFDPWLLGPAMALLALGWIMVGSASMAIADRELGQPFFYLLRHSVYVVIALTAGAIVLRVPSKYWERAGSGLLVLGLVLLMLVLVPGVNREVNGSARWLMVGGLSIQPSELMKLFVVVYLAGYLVRQGAEVRARVWAFLKPVLLMVLISVLLLLEPDFGTAVVLFATVLGMMFLAGVRVGHFGVLLVLMAAALTALMLSSPYRLERLTGFLDPWADPFDTGFQLTQALIAFGRGEWLGVGLGSGVQKLFYLPEAHTDFVFAVLGEELGMVGTLSVLALYVCIVVRALSIGARAHARGHAFSAHVACGLGLWLALQSLINMGVNMGVLPTKGLTLPLMSYGGTSMLVSCLAIALLLRLDLELREKEEQSARPRGARGRRGGRRT